MSLIDTSQHTNVCKVQNNNDSSKSTSNERGSSAIQQSQQKQSNSKNSPTEYNTVKTAYNDIQGTKKFGRYTRHVVIPGVVINDATKMQAVYISLISGASAGALAKTIIAPLDRAKISFQIQKHVPYTFKSAMQFIKETYKEKGVLALWRGNSATMARIIPYAAIHFTAHEQWRKILKVDQDGTDTKLKRFVAGSLAGVTGQSLTYPLDLARARMAVMDRTDYGTLRGVFVKIWTEEGPRTLFRGYLPTIVGVVPYAGCSFFTYETLKREYTILTGEPKANTVISLAFGAVAGAMGQTASYPLDIVRRRMQTMLLQKGAAKPSALTLLRKIYLEEGIRGGFYKGVSMNWIKGPIAVGISFSTYDFVQDTIRLIFNLKPSRQVAK